MRLEIPPHVAMLIMELIRQLGPIVRDQLDNDTPTPEPKPDTGIVSRTRFRLLRAQYNRKLFPEQYTEQNPDGLYRGKDLQPDSEGRIKINRESNVWLDWTGWDANGVELSREQLKRLSMGYQTVFRCNEGFIIGGGQNPDGTPKDWEKQNGEGFNISETVWRTSLGMTVRLHLSEEREYECTGTFAGQEGGPIVFVVS